ncbi:MAG: SAM-dependent methyltransferase [Cytophagales bacterium]
MGEKGKLYLIPCLLFPETEQQVLPSFNSGIIKGLSHFLVENERSARRFISGLNLGLKIEELRFYRLDKDTQSIDIEAVIQLIMGGNDVGVISEAGCPGVADPGALAVSMAHKNDIEVIPLIGPSAILLSLMASGFNGQSFVFHGYLPIEKNERVLWLKKLEKEAISKHQTQLFIETPYRNEALFTDIVAFCQPNTQLCVACDITSPNQFIKTTTIAKWKKEKPDLSKRPTVFLLWG